jgi:hypothetical protein
MKPSNLSGLQAIGQVVSKLQYPRPEPKEVARGKASATTSMAHELSQQIEFLKFKTAIQEKALVWSKYDKKTKGQFHCTIDNCDFNVFALQESDSLFLSKLKMYGALLLINLKDTSFFKPFKIKV